LSEASRYENEREQKTHCETHGDLLYSCQAAKLN
jgi:hypothetical protein